MFISLFMLVNSLAAKKVINMKKILSFILALIMIFAISATAFADNIQSGAMQAPTAISVNTDTVTIINDPELLAKANEEVEEAEVTAANSNLTLKNKVLVGQRYYSDSPFLADSIRGPMSVGPTLTLSTKATAGYNGECGVSADLITAKFGVNFSYEETVTRTFTFDPIPKNKTLTYRCYVNYNVYQFDVYNGSEKVGTSQYWTPVGIVVTQSIG